MVDHRSISLPECGPTEYPVPKPLLTLLTKLRIAFFCVLQRVHTEKSFLNHVNPNRIWIVIICESGLTPIGVPIGAKSIGKW